MTSQMLETYRWNVRKRITNITGYSNDALSHQKFIDVVLEQNLLTQSEIEHICHHEADLLIQPKVFKTYKTVDTFFTEIHSDFRYLYRFRRRYFLIELPACLLISVIVSIVFHFWS